MLGEGVKKNSVLKVQFIQFFPCNKTQYCAYIRVKKFILMLAEGGVG